jgi:hypothetical protein
MKSTILLTTALFLASAPSPDAKTISELSAGFLSVDNEYGLMASEDTSSTRFNPHVSAQLENLPIATTHKPADQIIDPSDKVGVASQQRVQVN